MSDNNDPSGSARDDRPLPFILRLIKDWTGPETPRTPDALFFRQRALLTGELMMTSSGADIQFSDLGDDA